MKSFVILVFSFLLSFVTNSQELQWIIKPSITEVDEIAVHNTAKPLVCVKKGALYGVKNLNNKLIIPIAHKELNISLDQKLIYSGDINSKRSAVYTLTIKGDTLKTNLNTPHQRHWRRTNKPTNKVLVKFAMENDLKVIEYENEKARVRYKLSAKNNKFSIDNITFAKLLGKDYIFLRINHRKGYVYDRLGNIVYHDPRMSSLATNGRGLYAANNIVLDTALNVIFRGNKEHPKLLKNYPLFTVQSQKNGKSSYRLVNEKGETLLPSSFSSMKQKSTNYLHLKDENGYHYYSLKEKKMLYHSKNQISNTNMEDYVRVTSKADSKRNYGIYHLLKQKFIIDTIYHGVSVFRNCIIAHNSEDINITTESVLFDLQGKERLRFSYERVRPLRDDHYFVSNMKEVNRVVDGKGNTVFEVDSVYILSRVDRNWLRTRDVRRNCTYYLVKDIAAGNIIPYESLVAFENRNLTKAGPYIVKKDEKYGLMSSDCDFILHCVYDKMLFTDLPDKKTNEKHSDVISVLENEKWGAFVVPGLE